MESSLTADSLVYVFVPSEGNFFLLDNRSVLNAQRHCVLGEEFGMRADNQSQKKRKSQKSITASAKEATESVTQTGPEPLHPPVILIPEEVAVLRESGVLCLVQQDRLTFGTHIFAITADNTQRSPVARSAVQSPASLQPPSKRQRLEGTAGKYWETNMVAPAQLALVRNFERQFCSLSPQPPSRELGAQHTFTAATFISLHRRGFWLTNGFKFGVDFLAYRADPRLAHACFMVKCIGVGECLSVNEMIRLSRVATAADKIIVFALPDTENGADAVKFINFDWIG